MPLTRRQLIPKITLAPLKRRQFWRITNVRSRTWWLATARSIQLILAKDEPAFPDWVSRKSFSRAQLSKFIVKTNPLLRWLEKPIRPRLEPVVVGWGERMIGVVGVIHALTLALPIPMGNLPQAVALILLALALIELDGLMAILGYIASIAAVIWLALVVLGLSKIVLAIF